MTQPSSGQDLQFSYLELRKAVGYIGVALPVVVAIGKIVLQGPGLEPTISSYYYTDLGNWFVGSLCAIGVFLLSTRGYPNADASRGANADAAPNRRIGHDQIAGALACIFAVGVALFPMAPAADAPCTRCAEPQQTGMTGWAHWTFAAPKKLQRNIVYRVCGIIILAAIALIFIVTHTSLGDKVQPLHPVFWLEALAVEAFAFAWLVKGEMILKDESA